jgi:CRP-like cAMP-binding protein
MATVVCLTDCEIYELSQSKTKELYYQNPAFGYAVLQIVINRLLEDSECSSASGAPSNGHSDATRIIRLSDVPRPA